MTKKRSTKRALLVSALSLLMCVSMLVGSTFAWFTDSVASAGNKIVAGSLDVELHMWNGSEYVNITEESDPIFGTGSIAQDNNAQTLWEPGKTQVAYLKIVNKGDLALKYTVGLSVENVSKDLYKVMQYAITPDVKDGTGVSAWNAANAKNIRPGTQTVSNSIGEMLPNDEHYFALSIHMDELAGNEYQGGEVNFDLTVLATQLTSEPDSFGDQYDAGAAWDGIIPDAQPDSLVLTLNETKNQGGTITIKDANAFVYLNKLAEDFKAKAEEIEGYDNYYYHWEWDIELETDINLMNIPIDTLALSFFDGFNGKGHTISNVMMKDGQTSLFDEGEVENLNVKNIVVDAPTANTVGAILRNKGSLTNVHVVNAAINGGKYVGGLAGKGASFNNCSIKDSTVTGSDKTVGGLVGYSIGDPNPVTVTGNTVDKVIVTGAYNVGGLLGQSQNETVDGNTVKNVTVISTTSLPADASSNEVRAEEIVARNVGATIGSNTYENVTVKSGDATSMGNSDMGVDVPKDVKLPDDAKFVMTEPVINEANKTVTIADASFKDADGNEVDLSNNTTPITVTIEVPFADGEAFNVYHDDAFITTAIVEGGKITYECLHFCEIKINASDLVPVATADELIEALEAEKGVIFTNDIKINPANMSNAYGKTGINVKKGQTIDGNGYTLNIAGAGGTWDSGINTTGGEIRNLKVTGSFRGIFINHTSDYSETVVLKNVILEGVVYTISCDQGLNQNLEAYNCTFNGWTSYAATLGTAKFINCNFGEGNGYKYCRPYCPTEFVKCTFSAGYAIDETRTTVNFEDCIIN